MLGLVLTMTLAAPLDAPLQLSLQDVDRRVFEVEGRASNAKTVKGLGIVAVVLGSMSGVGFIGGTISNIISNVASDVVGGSRGPRPNYTPLLVGALIGVSVGLAATFFGIHVGESANADREALEKARAVALAELALTASAAWERLGEPTPAPVPVLTAQGLTPPPLPAPEPGPRRPLVPRR